MLAFEHVNFIPKSLRPSQTLTLQEGLIGSWVIGVLMVLSFTGYELNQSRSLRSQIESAEARSKQVNESAEAFASKAKSVDESSKRLTLVKEFLKARTTWTEMLKELSLLTPSTVWISSLSTKFDQDKQLNLAIVGEAPSQIYVASLLLALESSFYFREVSMKNSDKMVEMTPNLYKFEFQVTMPNIKDKGTNAKPQ